MSGTNALRPMPAPTDGEAAAWSARLSTRASEQLVRTLAVATFTFLVWASLFKLDQVTHAVGRVAPAGGPQVVQHLEGGILTDILAKEGDRVKRGAVLVRLSNQFSAADLTNSKTEVAAMKIQLLRLEAESAGATAFEIDPALAALAPGIASSEADLFQSRTSQLRQDLSVIDAQIQTVRAEIRSLDARLASLRSEERVTIDQLRLMERALAAIPTAMPAASMMMSSGFGYRADPFTGAAAMHAGLDFKGAVGTPILAAAEGRVVLAGFNGGYGNSVEIRHANGIVTRYAHLSGLNVRKGQMVERGVRIGRMGSTGRSTGSHLHFEVRLNGQAINPRKFLEANPDVLKVQTIAGHRADSAAKE